MRCLLFSLFVVPFASFSQTKASSEKQGQHKVYLDANWKRVDDTTQALYCRYTWYDQGTDLYPMGPCGKKGYTLMHDSSSGPSNKLLNGVYIWHNSKGGLSSIHHFRNGIYISCEEFDKEGRMTQRFDYTQKCHDCEHGWVVYLYKRTGEIERMIRFCKNKEGQWPRTRG